VQNLSQLRAEVRSLPPNQTKVLNLTTGKIYRSRSFGNGLRERCHLEQVELERADDLKNRVSHTFLVRMKGRAESIGNVLDWIDRWQMSFSFTFELE
jgi:hypothetical protein